MSKTKIVNFRSTPELMKAYKQAASNANVSVSSWLRAAADRALIQSGVATPVAKAPSAPPADPSENPVPKVACVEDVSPGACGSAIWTTAPTGIHECRQCGVRSSQIPARRLRQNQG